MFVGSIDRVYRVLDRLGEGLNGEVFKVQGPEGVVGLKLLKKQVPGLTPQEHIALFKFEFSLLKGLAHPHIIQIRDFGYDSSLDRFYYTQEWTKGKNLEEIGPSLPLPKLQKLFLQALQGLAYLHRQSVLHGDLSPRNLLVTETDSGEPSLKLIDFGVSHRLLTGGTPACIAPEKILNEPVDARSDLYSLAVVFYSLFTGKNPFLRGNLPATLQAHLKFIPPAATAIRPELNPVWSRLLDWMMQKNPRNRADSAEACLAFLDNRHPVKEAAVRPRRLQKIWIDRAGILKQTLRFLQKVSTGKKPQALLLLGPLHLGQTELMTELKYEAELRGIRVSRSGDMRNKGPAIRMETWGFHGSPPIPERIESLSPEESLVIAAPVQRQEELQKKLGRFSIQTIALKPLSPRAMKKLLQTLTGQERIPTQLLKTLWAVTRGIPESLYQVLQKLAQDPLLVDVSGRWQLGIFAEMPGFLEDRLFGETLPSLPLSLDLRMDPKMAWLVSFNQARAWAKEEKFGEALERLSHLEKELPKVFSKKEGSQLLNRYYALLMKAFGWIYSKQDRLSEARQAFSAGLARLQEDSEQDQAQGIRLRNYLAFLDLQEGRVQEAIRTFSETARLADRLGLTTKKLITNNELGAAHLAAGEYEKAIETLEADLRFYAEMRNPHLMMKAGYSLAGAYAKTKNYRESRRAYEKVMETARRERNWDFLYRALNGLGNVSKLQGRLGEALDYYRRSLILVEYRGDFLSAAAVSQNRGSILSEMGRLDEALRDLELSRQLANKVPRSFYSRCLLARTYQELGVVQEKLGDSEQAKIYFSEAKNRAEEEPLLKDFRFYPLFSLAELSLKEGKEQAFRDYHAEAVHWADTPEKQEKLRELELRRANRVLQEARASTAESEFNRDQALANFVNINHTLLTEENPERLLKRILQYAAELSDAESVLLLESRDEGKWRVLEFARGQAGQEEIEYARRMAAKAHTMRKALRASDATAEEPFRRDPAVHSLHLRSLACIPVDMPDGIEIALYLSHRYKTGIFTESKLRLLEGFADQAGLALKNVPQLGFERTGDRDLPKYPLSHPKRTLGPS